MPKLLFSLKIHREVASQTAGITNAQAIEMMVSTYSVKQEATVSGTLAHLDKLQQEKFEKDINEKVTNG